METQSRGASKSSLDGGLDHSAALKSVNRFDPWRHLAQFVDRRCFTSGKVMEVKASYRLELHGQTYNCNPAGNEWTGGCPSAKILGVGYHDPVKKGATWLRDLGSVAETVAPYVQDDWNLLHGIVVVDASYDGTESLELVFGKAPANVQIVLDDVSITEFEYPDCSENLLLNPDFSLGTTTVLEEVG